MDKEQRAALVVEMKLALNKEYGRHWLSDPSESVKVIMPIIDRLLTDRAVTTTVAEPDAETVERVAKAIFGEPDGCDNRPEMWGFLDEGWRESCRNQARAAIAAMPSGKDAEWLDDALDSVHPSTLLKLRRSRIGTWDAEPTWIDDKGYWHKSRGTGTTRKAAILDAVQKAKEASGE